MTWSQLILFVIIGLTNAAWCYEWYTHRKTKRKLGRLEANHATLEHVAFEILAERDEARAQLHPSYAGYRSTDAVLGDMVDCLTCGGPRRDNHFVYNPTHVQL